MWPTVGERRVSCKEPSYVVVMSSPKQAEFLLSYQILATQNNLHVRHISSKQVILPVANPN